MGVDPQWRGRRVGRGDERRLRADARRVRRRRAPLEGHALVGRVERARAAGVGGRAGGGIYIYIYIYMKINKYIKIYDML